MNPNKFYVIKCMDGNNEKFFTGGYRKRKYPFLCKLFKKNIIVPELTRYMRESEFHLSPVETQQALVTMRIKHPEYKWFMGEAVLPDYTNEAMMPRFCIALNNKFTNEWSFYTGEGDNGNVLCSTTDINLAKWMNVDDINTTCENISARHRNYHYQAMPAPSAQVPAHMLGDYLANNPPKPMYMTFSLKRKK